MEKNYFIEHRMVLAGEYESAGKNLHALQIYNSILEENPSYSDAVLKTSDIYRRMGNLGAVSKMLEEFISKYPEDKHVRFYYGEFLLNNSEWNSAIEVLSYFTPEDEPVSAFFTGYAYFMLKEFELSSLSFKNYVSFQEPGELLYEAYFFLAKIQIELKNYQEAVPHLKKAESSLNNFWEFNYLSAYTYYHLDMHAHAVSLAERAIKLNGREAISYHLAGKIYLKLGEYPKAEKHLRKYITIKENVAPDTYAYLAEACLYNKKTREALELYEKALAADPHNKLALAGKKNATDYLNKNKVSDG
jgi:tetratricopeptide (TPR) repeat protein